MNKIKTDILVIGAGSGGLSVAAGAVQMGADVVLLEGHKMGGDCLNYGCVPSKALIASSKAAYGQAHARRYGVADVTPQVDYAAAKDHVKGVIAQIAPVDSVERFEGLGVRVIREFGRFVSESEVQAGEHLISARRIVIATGSSPLVPPIPGLDEVPHETNETLFDLRERPEHLLIIGGGPIGMEMAQAHRRLGSAVTVIEGAKALGKDDPETAAIVLDQLRAEGIEIVEEAAAAEVRGQAGAIEVEVEDGRVFKGSHLLMAVGRNPNLDSLDLDKAGVETTKAGVKVDDSLKSTNRRVYAIGDVAGGLQFTHVAGYHAGVVHRHPLGALRPAGQDLDGAYPLGHLYRARTGAGRADRGAGARGAWRPAGSHPVRIRAQRPFDHRARDCRADQGHGGERPPRGRLHRRTPGRGTGQSLVAGDRQQAQDEACGGHGFALSDGRRDQQTRSGGLFLAPIV